MKTINGPAGFQARFAGVGAPLDKPGSIGHRVDVRVQL
jgi:hypothetical protein